MMTVTCANVKKLQQRLNERIGDTGTTRLVPSKTQCEAYLYRATQENGLSERADQRRA